MSEEQIDEISSTRGKSLTDDEKLKLESQNSRLVTPFVACKLEKDSKKHWDLFYKRNETRFFKDRHWTIREFKELAALDGQQNNKRKLLEIGCGVGNFIFPLLEEGLNLEAYACDLSTMAVDIVKSNPLTEKYGVTVFQADVSQDDALIDKVPPVDLISLIFVLSAVHPEKFGAVTSNLFQTLKQGGQVLFRDYGRYDMAQLRFKAGHKIADNFYMRQDGTRTYFFTTDEITGLFTLAGFEPVSVTYVQRRTVNIKEGVDVPRIFVQGIFSKKCC